MMATVIVIFVLTNVPMKVMIILIYSNNYNAEIEMMAQFSLMLNHSANPFVYFLFSTTVRKKLRAFASYSCIRN
jgi:hypothetical protein